MNARVAVRNLIQGERQRVDVREIALVGTTRLLEGQTRGFRPADRGAG